MREQRKTSSTELKARIALEAIKGQQTVNEISAHCGVHPHQAMPWKQLALAELSHVSSERSARIAQDEKVFRA